MGGSSRRSFLVGVLLIERSLMQKTGIFFLGPIGADYSRNISGWILGGTACPLSCKIMYITLLCQIDYPLLPSNYIERDLHQRTYVGIYNTRLISSLPLTSYNILRLNMLSF